MATTMNSQHMTTTRTSIQKVCIVLGVFFVVAGLGGIVMPGMLGMHLSMAHNLIHIISGALALWVGYSDSPRAAYNFAIAFGVVYGILGFAGFLIGQPGYPGVGNMEADQNLLRIIPNVLEFGTMDHGVHVLLSAAFLFSAFVWKRSYVEKASSVSTGTSKNTTAFGNAIDTRTSGSNLRDASLGRSDINRPVDQARREDFENRI